MSIFHLDYETRSNQRLVGKGSVGAFRYAYDPSCGILCAAVAKDDQEPRIWRFGDTSGPAYEWLREMVEDPEALIYAHNAMFEIAVSGSRFRDTFGLPAPQHHQWRCTMAMARRAGLPASLEKCAEALNLENKKDKRGKDLINKFSVPQPKDIKKLGKKAGEFVQPWEAPEDFEAFCQYCIQDVRVERDIHKKLSAFELKGFSLRTYQLDVDINTRGIPVNLAALHGADDIIKAETEALNARFQKLTGFNPTQRDRVLEWLQAAGFQGADLKKDTMEEFFENTDFDPSTPLGHALNLRKQASFASLKKVKPMIACAGPHDNRVRGTLNYHGAGTGRWTASLIQPQNFKKPSKHLEKVTESIYRDILEGASRADLSLCYSPPLECIASAIRHFIHDQEGEFLDADYSAIEARIIAWQAQEQWRLDFLSRDNRIYEASAHKMFGISMEEFDRYRKENGIHHPLRAKGKVAELACIAEGQMVTTDRGQIPIEQVTKEMRVWDGKEFVSHEGVVYQGIKEVMTYEGLTATKDHIVFTEAGKMQFERAAETRASMLKPRPSWKEVRMGNDPKPSASLRQGVEQLLCTDAVRGMLSRILAGSCESSTRRVERLPAMLETPVYSLLAGSPLDRSKTEMHKSSRPRVSKLRSERDRVSILFGSGSGSLGYGEHRATSGYGVGPSGQQRSLRTGEFKVRGAPTELYQSASKSPIGETDRQYAVESALPLHHSSPHAEWPYTRTNHSPSEAGSSREKEELENYRAEAPVARTYDILNCGPRNRFVVSGCLVHNCGYQGGKGALIRMGALKEGLDEKDLPRLVKDWRAANPSIVQLWYDIENAAKSAVRGHGRHEFGVGCEMFCAETGGIRFLFMRLPSRRRIAYPHPALEKQIRWTTINKRTGEEVNHTLLNPSVEEVAKVRQKDPKARISDTLTYWGEIKNNQWGRVTAYGGSLTNNCVQGIAADVMAIGAHNAWKAGYEIVSLIHDEALAHYRPGQSIEEFIELLTDMPEWADGLPLKAAGGVIPFYRKD